MSAQHDELRRAPLFAALDGAQLERVRQRAAPVHLASGQMLFRQDDPAARFYFVRDGRMRLFRLGADGGEKVIELIGPGQTFAEALLFMGTERYPVCAAALEPTRLLAIDGADFKAMLRESPETCFALLGDLSRRLHAMIAEIDSLTLLSAQGRVARWLLGEVEGQGAGGQPSIRLRVSKAVLASRLSIKPETWSRVTRRLSEQGVVQVSGDLIEIRDLDALRRAGEGG
ncbi:MAG: cyclic nucleotide-binding domain-containing protein [Gammaproteobacteria bacterium]|nr:cyclic nucleotide-binding domain-containing protein [Gammaproteobacteria bacterium]